MWLLNQYCDLLASLCLDFFLFSAASWYLFVHLSYRSPYCLEVSSFSFSSFFHVEFSVLVVLWGSSFLSFLSPPPFLLLLLSSFSFCLAFFLLFIVPLSSLRLCSFLLLFFLLVATALEFLALSHFFLIFYCLLIVFVSAVFLLFLFCTYFIPLGLFSEYIPSLPLAYPFVFSCIF